MDMGTDIGVIFENGYRCGNSSTCPEPHLLPFLREMCNNACNCAANFERESMKNFLISIHAMVTQHLMKKEDVLDENHCVNNLEK